MLAISLSLIFAGTLFQHSNICDATVVPTIYGRVRGLTQLSAGNRSYFSFRGIPYAKPPIGQLRFRSPVPPEKWTNIWDATQDGPMCIQKNIFFAEDPPAVGQEDCLYINVYSSNDLKNLNSTSYPVMAFIHYGGFLSGSAQSVFIGPEYFMDEDIVLVSFNYRLGVFGFLSSLDDASPGNFGLKDQAAALQWIQDNIGVFGGDKNKVTIFGESAGSASVHHHILSSTSKNLFHGAISESGSALAIWTNPNNTQQKLYYTQQAKFVNCDKANDNFAIVECIRGIDATELVESSRKFKYFSTEPFMMFLPVTENKTDLNPKPFITKSSFDTLKSGDYNKVPWITGTNKDDGILRAAALVRQSKTLKEFNENFDLYGPKMFNINDETWKNIKDFYFNGQSYINSTDRSNIQGLIDVYTDRFFTYPLYQSLLLQLSAPDSPPIWVYNFAYKGHYTYGDSLAATNETVDFDWGVSHGDELLYLFTTPSFFPPLDNSDDILRKTMIKLWTNFAVYGNPTGTEIKWHDTEINWNPAQKPIDKDNKIQLNFLNITGLYSSDIPNKLEMNDEYYSKRINFWRNQLISENTLIV